MACAARFFSISTTVTPIIGGLIVNPRNETSSALQIETELNSLHLQFRNVLWGHSFVRKHSQ